MIGAHISDKDNRFEEVFEETFSGLAHFLETLLKDWAAAQDVAQEAYLRLYCLGLGAVAPGAERFWLFRVARNLAMNEIAKTGARRRFMTQLSSESGSTPNSPSKAIEVKEQIEKLMQMLDELPKIRREALLLREQGGFTYQEVASLLGISESQVKVDIFRARCALRQRLREKQRKRGE